MDTSDFIRGIAKRIENVIGTNLDVSLESTVPKEVWFSQAELIRGQITLRTAEQTENMDVVQLKQFDPYFHNKDHKITCRVPGCLATRKFGSEAKSEMVKRDLFLCKTHREQLMNLVSKRCAEEGVIVDIANFKMTDFKGYTSLIGVLEKALVHLKLKWWRKNAHDFHLAEMLLNTRNFLIITNAVLNPAEVNLNATLGPYLTIFIKALENPKNLQNWLMLLSAVTLIILMFYAITYEWIHIPFENPGARIGAGVAIGFAFLVSRIFNFSFEEKVEFYIVCLVAGGLIGGGLFSRNLDPRLVQQRNDRLSLRTQQFLLALLDRFAALQQRQRAFNFPADSSGNISLNISEQ